VVLDWSTSIAWRNIENFRTKPNIALGGCGPLLCMAGYSSLVSV
jgi:hypothetical protein